MDWVVLSLLTAVAFTAYSLVQKHTLDHHVDGASTFAALACIPHAFIAGVILVVSPPDWFSWPVLAMAFAGILHGVIQLLTGYAFRREADISRIVPIIDAYPLFVLVMALVLLGEVLTPLKAGAAALVTVGVMVASWHQALPGARITLNRSLLALFVVAVSIALYAVLAKAAIGEMSIWQMYAVAQAFAIPMLTSIALRGNRANMRKALASRPALTFIGASQAILLVAYFASLMAFVLGARVAEYGHYVHEAGTVAVLGRRERHECARRAGQEDLAR